MYFVLFSSSSCSSSSSSKGSQPTIKNCIDSVINSLGIECTLTCTRVHHTWLYHACPSPTEIYRPHRTMSLPRRCTTTPPRTYHLACRISTIHLTRRPAPYPYHQASQDQHHIPTTWPPRTTCIPVQQIRIATTHVYQVSWKFAFCLLV